jgi:Lar family restriction alleviation protein
VKQIDQDASAAQADNLAPCPFCGGAPIPDFIVDSTYLIKCSNCKTRSWFQASAADAVAAWNRRAVKPFVAAPAAVLTDADYAAIVKRYEDAGDVQNADIIRRQWTVARAAGAMPKADQASPVHQAQVENGRWIDIDAADIPGYQSCFATVRTLYAAPTPADADAKQLVVIGGQRVGKQLLLDLQRDAGRYRWLRDKADGMACTAAPMVASLDATGRVVGLLDGDELDAAVDMAAARRTTKTNRAANAQ